MGNKANTEADLKWLKELSEWLDYKFRVPGTDFRFGIDPIIGLIPYAGDVISYLISSILVLHMAKHGASGQLVLRMLFNLFVDLVIGGIPVAGQIGDFIFRANERNIKLYIAHIEEGKYSGSGLLTLAVVVLALLGTLALTVFLFFKLFTSLYDWIFNQ